jgi:patatin-like phospholipase/acyl hydrolase
VKKILCIDGGGMRGYLPAAVLVELERRTGRRCCELFDLIAGTSIGGILAALLASGMPASEAIQFFTVDGPHIFRRRWWRYFGLFGPRYAGRPIEKILARRFKGLEPRTRVLIPAFDLVTQAPYFFKFAPNLNYAVPLWQAARATSSAQIYFPAFQTFLPDGLHVFWDGGNVANNPAVCAYADAVRYWSSHRVLMLSLGCGSVKTATGKKAIVNARSMVNAGAIRNGVATVETLFEADSDEVDYQMTQLLGGNYIRLQPKLAHALPLDDASPEALLNLKDAAANAVRGGHAALENFLSRHENRR